MTASLKYKSDAFEAIHDAVSAMDRAGTISQVTMREFDESCLVVPPLPPAEIRRLRTASRVSQPVFARHLNTTASTVQKWESGAKRPSGMALKLLSVVQKHGMEILA